MTAAEIRSKAVPEKALTFAVAAKDSIELGDFVPAEQYRLVDMTPGDVLFISSFLPRVGISGINYSRFLGMMRGNGHVKILMPFGQ